MIEYKPFPISNFRTGFDEATEPWLLPRDAFQVMENAHLYRGVVEKINGYGLYTRMSYRKVATLSPAPDGTNKTFTATLDLPITSNNFYGSATISTSPVTTEIFTYEKDSATPNVVTLQDSVFGGTGTLNVSDGVLTLNFNTAPVANANEVIFFQYDSFASPALPIMGIKPYYAANGTQQILVFDTSRMGVINVITSMYISSLIGLNYGVTEVPHETLSANIAFDPPFDGTTTTFSGILGHPIQPGTVTITYYNSAGVLLDTITDTGGGGYLFGSTISSGYINYITGAWKLTFSSAPASTSTLNADIFIYGAAFTGTFSNFFSVANYQGKAFITNNVDAIYYYDGTLLRFLNTNLSPPLRADIITFDITRCLFVEIYQQRLLLISPVVDGDPKLNNIYWSTFQNPFLFTNDENLPASTSQKIVTYKIINTDLIASFSNSQWIFRYTGDAFSPFRWDSTNLVWRCHSSYGSINYDTYYTSIGKPAIVGSDGVNIRRADDIIPDFTDPYRIPDQTPALFLSQNDIGQCYGERFDDLKEGWLCYKSAPGSNIIEPSDTILAFNYTDETYATYTFPFSCLGFGTIADIPVWGNDYRDWIDASNTWDAYDLIQGALVDLAGDQFGNIFELDISYTVGSEQDGIITTLTNGSPTSINDPDHGLTNGAQIVIQGVIGPVQINNQVFIVTVTDANNFTVPFDSSTLPDYVSGGIWFTAPVMMNSVTKNFNPFVEEGQLVRFGFLDLFLSANTNTTFRVQFYKDDMLDPNYDTYYQESIISLPGNGQTKVWKRIYVGAVAKEHTVRFYQNPADFSLVTLNQPVRIHAMVPYFKSAGRIFN